MLQFSNLQRCDRVIGRLSDGLLNMSIIFLIIALRLFIYLITSGTSKFERKNRRSRPRRKTERQPQVSMTSLFFYTWIATEIVIVFRCGRNCRNGLDRLPMSFRRCHQRRVTCLFFGGVINHKIIRGIRLSLEQSSRDRSHYICIYFWDSKISFRDEIGRVRPTFSILPSINVNSFLAENRAGNLKNVHWNDTSVIEMFKLTVKCELFSLQVLDCRLH